MKRTIKRSCFRLKQWALSLFAMLCFGAAWGELVTTPMGDPSAGYIRTGAGEYGELTVVVFTNHTKEVSWTAPKDISNLQFLVVGGGGGGGGHCYDSSTDKYCQGGTGGGGGGVVTGAIENVSCDTQFSITVGKGGDGGKAETSTAGAGAGTNGGNSSFSITNVTYITAYGGGGDGGFNSLGRGIGGSNSGMRGADNSATPSDLISVNFIGEGANVLYAVNLRNKGGKGYQTGSMSPGGGGGGACGHGRSLLADDDFPNPPAADGSARCGSGFGGDGGEGLATVFIGVTTTFGAGGGGGVGKTQKITTGKQVSRGGCDDDSGAGYGVGNADGTDAAPNQGGGGGGGSYGKNGGAGGSGIVAFSYVTDEAAKIAVDAAQVESMIVDKFYTGGQLSSGLEDADGYSVKEQDVDRINVGTYTVTVTLKDGFEWSDGNTDMSTNFTWQITQNPNSWKTEPYLTSESGWTKFTASEMECVVPEPEFGTLSKTIASNGITTAFDGTLPTDLGVYTIAYSVEGTENYAALSWERTFAIRRAEKIDVGYKIYDLGEKSNEVAIVFTESTDWTVPASLRNAQFLVVGGGGGGGAGSFDKNTDSTFHGIGGAGGGGGGVVTGLVNFVKGATMAITIGAGGNGGSKAKDNTLDSTDGGGTNNQRYGASDPGSPSSFGIGDTAWVTAKGGGRDRGASILKNMSAGNIGGVGGSGGGNRSPNSTENAVTDQDGGSVNSSIINVLSYKPYAKPGGIHNPLLSTLYSSAGGGGATEKGFMAIDNENPGNGGAGLYTDISGTTLCYGSGGGGGTTASSVESCGQGGPGAGNGNSVADGSGYAGMANRGGGGGGGYAKGGTGGSGVVVFRYAVYAAAIGDTLYATFEEAFNAAKDGDTITLLDDVSISEKYTIGKNLTIDLCGCTISAEGNGDEFCVSPGFSLTVTDTNDNLGGNVGTVIDQYGNELVATDGVYTGPADTDYIAQIGDKKYLSLQAAVDAAQGGETITLLANVELTDDVTVNKSVTLAVGACTLTIPSGKTITIDADKSLAVTCGTGGLEVDGTIAVNGTLDVSGLSYGTSGLIANKAGNLAISESGSVKLMSVWDSYSPNWLATNSSTFFADSAEGAKLVQGSGTYTFNGTTWLVANAVAVTQVTASELTFQEGFTTLAAAIAASVDGNVTLLANVALDTTFIVEKTLTLDMGGNTVTADFTWSNDTPAAFWVKNGGDLTLTNGTLTATVEGVRLGVKQATDPATKGTLTIASDASVTSTADVGVMLYGGSTLTSSGTISSTSADYAAIQGNGLDTLESTINITGGTVTSESNHAIYHPQPGTLTISGGTISGVTGIEMRAGTLNMSGGVVTATGEYDEATTNNSGSTVDGAAIVLSQHTTGKNVTATISGGEITATENGKTFVVANTTGADPVSVTATIAAEVSFDASKAVVLIDTLVLAGDATSGYGLGTPVAKIGDVKYPTLEAALAAAEADQTITLLADVTCSTLPSFTKDGVVNVDINGFMFVSSDRDRVRPGDKNYIKFVSGFGWEVYDDYTSYASCSGDAFRVFPTLDEAIAYEPSKLNPARIYPYENVVQNKDVTLRAYSHGTSSTICVDPTYDIVWDLNGYTVLQENPTGNPLETYIRGKLTLNDSSDAKTGKWIAAACGVTDPQNSWYGSGGPAFIVYGDGELILNGGTVSIARNAAEIVNTGGLLRIDGGKMQINDGVTLEVEDLYGIMNWGGDVTVNGGTFNVDTANHSATIYNYGYYGAASATVNSYFPGMMYTLGTGYGSGANATVNVPGILYYADGTTTTFIAPIAGTYEGAQLIAKNDGFVVTLPDEVAVIVDASLSTEGYTTIESAIAAADDGDEIYLVADVELTADVTVDEDVTLNVGANTLTLPSANTITVAEGKSLAVTCGTGGLVVDGTIAVNGMLDVSDLSYGASGLIANRAGNLAIGATGSVKLMSAWDAFSPNWLATNSSAFFKDSVTGAQLVQGSGTYTFNGTTWLVANAVAMTQVTANGLKYQDGFATLQAAVDAADEGTVIEVIANVNIDAAIQVTKKVTIDLNGFTVATTQNDTVGDGVFCVTDGGELTIEDSVGTGVVNGVGGNNYNIAVWANGGKVIINGGKFTNDGATDSSGDNTHFDLIYVKNGGSVEINGGTFIAETPAWTLNIYDAHRDTSSITVKGGTFYGFNPADNSAEGTGTDFCAEGYEAVEDAATGTWTVQKAATAVATFDGAEYATVTGALEAAQAAGGGTVTLIADADGVVEIPGTGLTYVLDLNKFTLKGRIYAANANLTVKNGSVIHDTGSKAAIQMEAGSLVLSDVYLESNYHGIRLNGTDTTCLIESGTYKLTKDGGTYNLLYNNGSNTKFTINGGEFTSKYGSTYTVKAMTGTVYDIYGGIFNGGDNNTLLYVEGTGLINLYGGTYEKNPTSQKGTLGSGYKVVDSTVVSGYFDVVEQVLVAPGETIEVSAADEDAALKQIDGIAVTVPAGANVSDDVYAGYFKLVATLKSEGVYTVSAVLDPAVVTPTIGAIAIGDGATVTIDEPLLGLYYSVKTMAEVNGDAVATSTGTLAKDGNALTLTPAFPEGEALDKAFFKVVVGYAAEAAEED